MAITGLAASGGDGALLFACLALPILPGHCGATARSGLFITAILAYILGPTSAVIAVPVALALSGARMIAARALMALSAAMLLAHQFEGLPALEWLSIHPGSTAFIILPALAVAVSFGPAAGWRAVVALMLGALMTVALIEAGAGRWFNHAVLTSAVFRVMAAIIPVVVACFFLRPRREEGAGWRFLVSGGAVGAAIALALPTNPVTSIMFDESHGTWETARASFGPDEFGRAVNYTYGLIYRYAERVVGTATTFDAEDGRLPDAAVFVLKMPTFPLSEAFAARLEAWVRSGGRLLVVADHTDLYDTTQYLNDFLASRFGLRLNPDAVYNPTGMPTVPVTGYIAALFGRIDANGRPSPWQTGTSLAAMPANTVGLAFFGPSFSEPGDYSHQNRFGPFVPRASLRFTNHLAVAAFGVGSGAVALMLDSTPWSNFSFFREQYRHMFRSIVHALKRPIALQVWGWGALALAGLAILSALWRHPAALVAGGVTLGLTLGAAAEIGEASWSTLVEGRDFGLRVVAGGAARFEFLKQLVGPGERNYARIVSAMAKYDLDPIASTPGSEVPDLAKAKQWLLIEPSGKQLPSFDEVVAHLRRSGDLAVLFAPDQAADKVVRAWLGSLGLFAQKSVGLAVAEDAQSGLLNRKGPALLRDTRAVTGVLTTSLLKDREANPLLQSYTVRPTTMPRTSGLLTIGFSADQFSDDAVGDVWEGIQPASIGRHRERQLAAALAGEDFLSLFPAGLVAPSVGPTATVSLPAFALFDNGKTILSGKFDEAVARGPLSPSENPVSYLADLRQRAIAFIQAECPKSGATTTCGKRFLGADIIEWMVTWAADDSERIIAVELLHERRFSGMGSTVNVVFGQ